MEVVHGKILCCLKRIRTISVDFIAQNGKGSNQQNYMYTLFAIGWLVANAALSRYLNQNAISEFNLDSFNMIFFGN